MWLYTEIRLQYQGCKHIVLKNLYCANIQFCKVGAVFCCTDILCGKYCVEVYRDKVVKSFARFYFKIAVARLYFDVQLCAESCFTLLVIFPGKKSPCM